MKYRVRLTAAAQRQYDSLPPPTRRAVDRAIAAIRADPTIGAKNWTYSAGDVVVLYTVDDVLITITVLRISSLK